MKEGEYFTCSCGGATFEELCKLRLRGTRGSSALFEKEKVYKCVDCRAEFDKGDVSMALTRRR